MDATVKVFKEDFDRFYDMLLQQIDRCPDELWVAKEGGYLYWQQVLHIVGVTELYVTSAIAQNAPLVFFSEEGKTPISKDDMRKYAADIRQKTYAYLENLKPEQLLALHPFFTERMKKDTTYLAMLIALVRHLCYHIGCLDSLLRNHGLKGVY